MYICCLIELGKKKELNEVLSTYNKKHGTWNFDKYLLASRLVTDSNLKKFEKIKFIDEILKENDLKELLSEIISDKTIAIVGNAGSEVNKGSGDEIDAHDVVIRFNNYPLSGYENDYGKKTTIWVRNCEKEIEDRNSTQSYDLTIWGPDLTHILIPQSNIDILYDLLMEYRKSAAYIPYEYYDDIIKHSKIKHPTTGLLVVWIVYKIRKSLKNVDLYGFSFMEEKPSYKHYYDSNCKIAEDHDVDLEKDVILKLKKETK